MDLYSSRLEDIYVCSTDDSEYVFSKTYSNKVNSSLYGYLKNRNK